MRISLLALSLFAVAAANQQPQAPPENPPSKAYLLFPVRTELQRQHYFKPNEQFFLMVHGDSLIDGQGKIDPSSLDLHNLLNSNILIERRDHAVRAHLIFAKRPPEPVEQLLKFAILGWMHDNGFGPQRHVTFIGEGAWKAAIKHTGQSRGLFLETESEDSVGDESIRVYPVRTVLSRLMSGNADCVVLFPRPFGKDATGTLNEDSKARVKELVTSLKLKEQKCIEFTIWEKTDANREAVDRFTNKTAPELAKELGFDNCNIARDHTR